MAWWRLVRRHALQIQEHAAFRCPRRWKHGNDQAPRAKNRRGGPPSSSAEQQQQQHQPVVSSRWKFQQAAAKLDAMAAAAKAGAKAADVTTIDIPKPAYVKTKKLSKTAGFIMNIINREAVLEAKQTRNVPVLKPGYVVQLKVELPENKRRVQEYKGIILGIRKSGIHTTFRIRRHVGGTFVENVLPLYSPHIKDWKVLDRKLVHRAKLYYIRDGKWKLKSIPVRRKRRAAAAAAADSSIDPREGAEAEAEAGSNKAEDDDQEGNVEVEQAA